MVVGGRPFRTFVRVRSGNEVSGRRFGSAGSSRDRNGQSAQECGVRRSGGPLIRTVPTVYLSGEKDPMKASAPEGLCGKWAACKVACPA